MPRNNENAFDRYRRTYDTQSDCLRKKTAYFLKNHESSVTIQVNRTEEEIPAVLIFSDKEGADEVTLFVSINDDFIVRDYFTWKSITFFAYEQIEIVKEVNYIKYKALQCNVYVNDSFWAYFKSTLRSARDNTMSNKTEISTLIPLLIAPRNEQLTIGGRISFNDQVWDIQDGDIFSISGIGYYYLSRGMNSRDDEDWEPEEPIPTNQYYVGSEITVSTENGYFTTNQKFKLKKRAMSFVTILPLEVGKLEVITLKQGEPITNTFIIKENV